MANKIGMFTMFSTLALGHEFDSVNRTPPVQAIKDSLSTVLANLLEKIDKLESKQITGNYYFENEEEITVYGPYTFLPNYLPLFDFEVQEGETLDLSVTYTCDDPISFTLYDMDL